MEDAITFTAEVEVWQIKLSEAAAQVQAVIIVGERSPGEPRVLAFRADGPLSFVSSDQFSEVAGAVLVEGQDILDSQVLGKVAGHLTEAEAAE